MVTTLPRKISICKLKNTSTLAEAFEQGGREPRSSGTQTCSSTQPGPAQVIYHFLRRGQWKKDKKTVLNQPVAGILLSKWCSHPHISSSAILNYLNMNTRITESPLLLYS